MKSTILPVRCYDLDATLTSGQAFRWRKAPEGWESVIDGRWVRLVGSATAITATVATPISNWDWLKYYLQTDVDIDSVLSSFPVDEPMRSAVTACKGLRLLRQDPWECLASFICSSNKQIVQIQQIIGLLTERCGVPVAGGQGKWFSFPTPQRIAQCTESELRACKMGFRAPNLLRTAQKIEQGQIDLAAISQMDVNSARDALMSLPGVGPKIADCVLLFAYGFPTAFPVDVWVHRGLRELYFRKSRPTRKRLIDFSQTHFGPNAGYAQQYLFHYMRTQRGRSG